MRCGTMARLSKLVGLCSLVLVAGCVQIEEKYIIYSDGSGKIVKTATMDQSNMETLKGMIPPGSGGGTPGADITKSIEGTIGQKVQMVGTAYFEDITKVQQPGYIYGFTKRDDGGVEVKIEIDIDEIKKAMMNRAGRMSGMGGDEGGEDLGETPSEGGVAPGGMGGLDPGMMEGIMSQMKQSIVIVLPGEVTNTSVGDKEGRVVTYVLEGGAMAGPAGTKIAIEANCGRPTADVQKEFAAFQKELEAAKKASEGN